LLNRLTFETDDVYDDEYYFVDDDDDTNEVNAATEDDDESIRVAVWVDPTLKSNMGGLVSGLNMLARD
jgi:hypothetical protein